MVGSFLSLLLYYENVITVDFSFSLSIIWCFHTVKCYMLPIISYSIFLCVINKSFDYYGIYF
jgi:hypothetical protein